MAELRRAWVIWAAFCAAGMSGAIWGLLRLWDWEIIFRWLIPTGGLLLYQLTYLYRYLDQNYDSLSGRQYSHLGLANWLTMVRGVLLSLVAGFLLVPKPDGWLAWVPALLYLAAMLIDYMDGYAARLSSMTTSLGSRLDMHFDGQGYIIGGLLLVLWGQVPNWYLLVALARPLYILGERVLLKQNKRLRSLYPNPFRRALSGAQMGFTAALLFPVFTPPGTTIAAALYMLPFLINFSLDWLWVSGLLPEAFIIPSVRRSRLINFMRDWFPLLLRTVLVVLLIIRAERASATGVVAELYQVLHGLAILAVLTGSAGRVFAVGTMLISGLYLRSDSGDLLAWGMLLVSLALFFSGTGRFSLWTPEDWLIYHLAGDKVKV